MNDPESTLSTQQQPDPAVPADPVVEAAPAESPAAAADPPADPESDPLFRAQLEQRKAQEVARLRQEAEDHRAAERAALEVKLRQEAEQTRAAEAAEQDRQAKLTREEAMQEQIAELARKDAEREQRLAEAERKVQETDLRLEFVREVTASGKALASNDAALEDLAMSKAQTLLGQGKSMAEAVAAMAEDKGLDYLFARPRALAVEQTSTTAGASAPRGSSNPAPVPGPKAFDAWGMTKEQFAAWESREGWRELVEEVPRGGRPLN